MKLLIKSVCLCGMIVCFSTGVFAAMYNVPADYSTIQLAINASLNGDSIVVSPGTYVENINFNGKNIILTSTIPTDPNIVEATIIDGNSNGPVVTFSGSETSNCILRGFTITNGYADSSPDSGGGIYGKGTHATIENCTISGNRANYCGNGIYWCNGIISKCNIIGNHNTAGATPWSVGGGLYNCNGTISNCIIAGNTVEYCGGGLTSCNGEITNCMIIGNTSGNYGGGFFECDGTISNCIISANTAFKGGGFYSSITTGINCCTIVGNMSQYGGGVYSSYYSITKNSIIWGNSAEISGNQWYGELIPRYSCIQDWTGGGTGNISNNPLFADTSSSNPANWDVRLSADSPCIDKGTNSWIPAADIEGNPRPFDGNYDSIATVDMGAYEYHEIPESPYLYAVPDSFDFYSLFEVDDNPTGQFLTIYNFGSQNLNWLLDLTGKPDWLTVIPTSGTLAHADSHDVMLSVDATYLAAGLYSYTFEVIDPAASNSPQTVTVNLDVIGPTLNVSSNSVAFTALKNETDPNDHLLTVLNSGGGTINWTIDTIDKPGWLAITPTNGSLDPNSSEPVTLSVDITGLASGQYSYSFQISDLAALNSPQTLYVTLGIGDDTVCVPEDFSTIQSAINVAPENGVIIVLPGTYYENINFNGKDITLTSTDPEDLNIVASTIIGGGQNGSVVTFSGNETIDCKLTGFTIKDGFTEDNGGGINGNDTRATIEYCKITGNMARYGGGVASCDGVIINCSINNNMADFYGGGLCFSHATISNCLISHNIADHDGGGLDQCHGLITNCLINNNTAGWGGGLFFCNGVIVNCTIADNIANNQGGGLSKCRGTITNCIIWGNSPEPEYEPQIVYSSAPTYSCIHDWAGGGIGNITNDPNSDPNDLNSSYNVFPLFVDPNNGNYHLKSRYGRWDSANSQWVYDSNTSPCIDAGDPEIIRYWDSNGTPADPNDDFLVEYLDPNALWQNELWPHGDRINMGAYGGTPQASMSPNPVGNIADLDHDDTVGILDLELLSEDWLYAEILLDTDLNRNGKVDIADFADFAQQWLWVEP